LGLAGAGEALSSAIDDEVARQLAVMREGAVEFYGQEELRAKLAQCLREDRPLRVKLGMDPSAPDLHLGHTVVLSKLRRFQDLGHTPIFLVGDFTARIGDPTGRKKTRPALSAEEVKANAATYVAQAGLVLKVNRAEIRFNSEWMDTLSPSDWIRLCSRYTVARLLERDDFAKRYAANEPIAVHELLYPFAQAYDSVALYADVEIGGTDQTFNLLMAREIQRDSGQLPQAVITHPLLRGTDGVEKMSKSLGNSIGLLDAPEEMYGRVMSIPDALLTEYYDLLSAGAWEDLRARRGSPSDAIADPLAFKHELAIRIVARFHGEDAARGAREHFQRVVQRKEAPNDVAERRLPLNGGSGRGLFELLVELGLAKSRSEARRLVSEGAVSVDGRRIDDATLVLEAGSYLIQVGKRRFARLSLGDSDR
jgi:tyrosyl-tRNA synthetase